MKKFHTRSMWLATIFGAVLMTCLSFVYQPKVWTVTGNLCNTESGLCFEQLPAGGFPLQYLKTDALNSPADRPVPFLDHVDSFAFGFDIAFYALVILVVQSCCYRKCKKGKERCR